MFSICLVAIIGTNANEYGNHVSYGNIVSGNGYGVNLNDDLAAAINSQLSNHNGAGLQTGNDFNGYGAPAIQDIGAYGGLAVQDIAAYNPPLVQDMGQYGGSPLVQVVGTHAVQDVGAPVAYENCVHCAHSDGGHSPSIVHGNIGYHASGDLNVNHGYGGYTSNCDNQGHGNVGYTAPGDYQVHDGSGDSINVAIISERKIKAIPSYSSGGYVSPTAINVDAGVAPILLNIKSRSSPIIPRHKHINDIGSYKKTYSRDKPHRMTHIVKKPVIHQLKEVSYHRFSFILN